MPDIMLIISLLFSVHYVFTDSVSSLSYSAIALVLHVALVIFGPRSRREAKEVRRQFAEIRAELLRLQTETQSLKNKGELTKWKQ